MKRLLLVEDDPFIAMDIEGTLVESGFVVAGSAGSVEKALELVASLDFDAAILDANLAGESSGPIAVAIGARKLPYIVLSGYSASQQPEELRQAVLISKPFNPSVLVEAVRAMLSV